MGLKGVGMAIDFTKTAAAVVEKAGGQENVKAVTHCMTRLRFIVNDPDKADMEAIKQVDGVLGCVYSADQLQVIMGQNLIDTYNEVVRQFSFKEVAPVEDAPDREGGSKLSIKSLGQMVVGYIVASVTPVIPGLIAGGMLKVSLMLATLANAGIAATSTYALLSIAANAPFYFLPIWIAYGASKKLGGTSIYAMAVAAAMFAPDFLALVNADPQVSQDLFGMPVMLKSYASGLFPALLLSLCAYGFEKLFNRVIPGIFKSVFVGSLTVLCTYVLTMLVFAPLGTWIGEGVVAVLMGIYGVAGPFALAILAGTMPFLIMVGVHTVFGPFMLQLLDNPGYDALFRPALLLHNMAEGGACLGVAIRAKDKAFKSEALSIAVGCILAGVTEPALYGITFRLKKPLYGVVAGGAAAGLVGGVMGMRAYIMGYSNIMALPIFQDTVIAAVAAVAVAIVVPLVVTMAVGFDEEIVTGKKSA